MKLKEFFCKLACGLRNALCWLYRDITVDALRFYFSSGTWKDFWGFIKSIIRDFNYALKMWVKKVFKGEKPLPIPLKKGILPLPGENAYAKVVIRIAVIFMIVGIIAGLFFAIPIVKNSAYGVGLLIVLFLVLLLAVLYQQGDNNYLGYLGERTVAEELEKYGRNQNWRIFHAFIIPKHNSDIDHIVVCPNGIFCVETKTWRWLKNKEIQIKDEKIYIKNKKNGKIYDNNIHLGDWKPVTQARYNAKKLRDFLKDKCSFEIQFVVPVVFFVNTYVSGYPTSELIIGNSEKVGWFFGKHEKTLFSEHGKERNLTPEQIEEISQILEQASRTDIKKEKELLEK